MTTTPTDTPTTSDPATYDPLRLCVITTAALIAWLVGPLAVAAFAALGLAGYVRARRAGLRTSRCVLRDTRLVIAYLCLIFVAAGTGFVLSVVR